MERNALRIELNSMSISTTKDTGHALVHEVTYFPSFHDIYSNTSLQMPLHLHPLVASFFASTARALSPGFRACLPSFAWRDLSEVCHLLLVLFGLGLSWSCLVLSLLI